MKRQRFKPMNRVNFFITAKRFKYLCLLFITLAVLYILTQVVWLNRLNGISQKLIPEVARTNKGQMPVVIDFVGEHDKYSAHKNLPYHIGSVKMIQKYDKFGRLYSVSSVAHEDAVIRGVRKQDRAKYQADNDGMFMCLSGEPVRIWFSQVNDDYCDCDDGSDEPGTSACDNGHFYCEQQIEGRDEQWVSASKVNDGICDCCDGSEEYLAKPLPPHFHPELQSKVDTVPCDNRCMKEVERLDRSKDIADQGRRLKQDYLRNGIHHTHTKEFGERGVFYLLSTRCYNHSSFEYEFTVCPFRRVTQRNRELGSSVSLGSHSRWVVMGKVLHMSGGDGARCPHNHARTTQITFSCGLTDVILDISETETCSYKVTMSTPAAC